MIETLDVENRITLQFVQSLLGSISSNFRMIFIEFKNGEPNLNFILEDRIESDLEEIEEIAGEFEALFEKSKNYHVTVVINPHEIRWPLPPARVVFCRKEQ